MMSGIGGINLTTLRSINLRAAERSLLMMLRPPSTRDGSLPHQNNNSSAAADERLAHSKKRLQRILQRGQIFLCLSFALMTFTLNMIFFAKVNSGNNDIHANISDAPVFSDAPILNDEVARRNDLKMRQRGRWKKSKGIRRTELYNSTRYHDAAIESGDVEGGVSSQALRMRRNKMKNASNNDEQAFEFVNGKRTPQSSSSTYYHPKVACFHLNGCDDFISEGIDLLPSLTRYSEDSIPIISRSRRSKTQQDSNTSHEGDDNDTLSINNGETTTCRQARSIESRTTIHPTCNDIHSLGFDDQMFDKDYSSRRGESIDLLAVGGANSVWKTISSHNGENAILKTSKYLKAFDKDRLELYVLDAMVAGAEGNPQLFSLLQSENDVAKTSPSASTQSSSSWNHIMPIYSHCYTATIAPVASGTLKEYVTTYPETHNGETIDPLDKLRLALQVARGLYQMQMYRYGKPTFAHLDLNPNQYLVFHPQLGQSSNSERQSSDSNIDNNIPVLQINDFNRGRFLHWNNQNNTCPFQFDGCDKNTRGSRWHAPDRFIGCIDVNERIDTFALGGIFFFLLSDGEPPFYNERRTFGDHIKEGDMPSVPKEAADRSGDHPAYEALSEMVVRCRALRIEDRPSSLEVVRMLEDKLRQIELGSM